jgi:hypothetical protein
MVFKIRTTQPLCYVVKPNQAIIEAKGKARIDINFVPNDVSLPSLTSFNSLTSVFSVDCDQHRGQQVPSADRLHRPEE